MAKKKKRAKPDLKEVVDRLIGGCVRAVENRTLTGTLTDLIKLRDLHEQFAPHEPVKRDVKWIDGPA